MSPNNSIPVLHVEESIRRYYDVKTKSGRTHRKKYYDVDWRFYIMRKYGCYMVCGTRCPMRECYNEEWPVVSASFRMMRDAFNYISLLIGSNKVNMTLFVSRLAGNDNDIAFTQPTNARFRELDVERGDRRGELVGYDRLRISSSHCGESRFEKMLGVMSELSSVGIMPFMVSPHPSTQTAIYHQPYATKTTADSGTGTGTGSNFMADAADAYADMPPLEPLRTEEDDYGYIFGVNDYDHDAYAEVD